MTQTEIKDTNGKKSSEDIEILKPLKRKCPKWTGFRNKTLWDWMNLISLPVILTIVTLWLNESAKGREEAAAEQKERQTILTEYLTDIPNFLKDSKLNDVQIQSLAKARTASTMQLLEKDPTRQATLLNFLRQSGLLGDPLYYQKGSQGLFSMFHEINLKNIDLSHVDLYRVNLSKSDLSGDETKLNNAILNKANLQGIALSNAELYGAKLDSVNLRNATLIGTKLQGADLAKTNLIGANLTKAEIDSSSSFKDAFYTDNSNSPNETIFPKDFNLELEEMIKLEHNADLTNKGDLFRGTNLSELNLSGAQFQKSNLDQVDFTNTKLRNAELSKVSINEAILNNTDLHGATLINAHLKRADLTGADLTGADLTGADLTEADLTGADLTEADLTGADLTGANLTGAKMAAEKLKQAKLCNTILSNGKKSNRNCPSSSSL